MDGDFYLIAHMIAGLRTVPDLKWALNEYFLNEMNKQMNEWILCSLQFPVLRAQKMLTASKMAPAFAKMDFSLCLRGPLRNVKVKKKSALTRGNLLSLKYSVT